MLSSEGGGTWGGNTFSRVTLNTQDTDTDTDTVKLRIEDSIWKEDNDGRIDVSTGNNVKTLVLDNENSGVTLNLQGTALTAIDASKSTEGVTVETVAWEKDTTTQRWINKYGTATEENTLRSVTGSAYDDKISLDLADIATLAFGADTVDGIKNTTFSVNEALSLDGGDGNDTLTLTWFAQTSKPYNQPAEQLAEINENLFKHITDFETIVFNKGNGTVALQIDASSSPLDTNALILKTSATITGIDNDLHIGVDESSLGTTDLKIGLTASEGTGNTLNLDLLNTGNGWINLTQANHGFETIIADASEATGTVRVGTFSETFQADANGLIADHVTFKGSDKYASKAVIFAKEEATITCGNAGDTIMMSARNTADKSTKFTVTCGDGADKLYIDSGTTPEEFGGTSLITIKGFDAIQDSTNIPLSYLVTNFTEETAESFAVKNFGKAENGTVKLANDNKVFTYAVKGETSTFLVCGRNTDDDVATLDARQFAIELVGEFSISSSDDIITPAA